MNKVNKIIIGGASITNSPWYTWADFLSIESGITPLDLCVRGAGNEYIVSSVVKNSAELTPNTLVVVMLTSFDKFDWYVEGQKYQNLLKEKHTPKAVSDHSGFWCTGSWFPGAKQAFSEQYYTHDYFCTKTIQQIMLLRQVCAVRGAQLCILYDAPIWTHTEQDINRIGAENLDPRELAQDYLGLPLTTLWAEFVSERFESLIGYCWSHSLPWYNQTYKGHPPSGSHYEYYKHVVRPQVHDLIKLDHTARLTEMINQFDQHWTDG